LYGSTSGGGASADGTLFRADTNGTFTKLHDFSGVDGAEPRAALVVGPDGALYGSTWLGGTSEYGTLFRVETSGKFTKLHDFNSANGGYPETALVVGAGRALYGSSYNSGPGTLFRLETNGTFTELHTFNGTDGSDAYSALVVGPDGALYGSTYEGGNGSGGYTHGTLFRVETNGTFTELHTFNGTDGSGPSAALVVGPDGALYGSTYEGGTNGDGTLFRLETNGRFTKLYDFDYAAGGGPEAALVVGPDGALYGSSLSGGTNGPFPNYGYGTLFRLETNGSFTSLHSFNGTDGDQPMTALTVGPGGALYGSGNGPLFRVETDGTFTIVNGFNSTIGAGPKAALVVGPDGALYGSTATGGTGQSGGYGTLFRLETNGSFTEVHDFNGTNGATPLTALTVGPDGALYGSTYGGGTNYNGTLFRLETNGTFTKLYDFNRTTGAGLTNSLVVGADGGLYGPTPNGGANGVGTLFRLGTNGTVTRLHDFNRDDAYEPDAALVVGRGGALYGSTKYSGSLGPLVYGTLFRLETNGTFTKLHSFNLTNGAYPLAALVVGPDGALYGSTENGGTNGLLPYHGYGTLFRLDSNGAFTRLHDFNYTNDGAYPSVALAVGPDGALYGSTPNGGTNGKGTLFRLETNGTFTKLCDFNGTNGASPSAALVVGPDGAFYGSTQYGGASGNGTLFQVEPDGTFAKLYDFNETNGANPATALTVGPDGALYGSTPKGGPRRGGILFKIVLNRPPVALCHDVTVSAGPNCSADASVDNGSFDPDAGDTITVRQEPPGPYPLGATPVTLTVTDNHGASNSCTATVTVVDTTGPTISDVVVTPNVLWPPNGKMVGVTVNYAAADDCGGVTNVLVVSSNEAANGPAPDWVIEDEHHVQLRAERSGGGSGRVYRITVISTDNTGNLSTKSTVVTVPKSQGK
jgi:uncharacterized repeat protein (TIGR03803 family)